MAKTSTPTLTSEKLAWIRLSRSENVGPVTFNRLISRYQTAEKALAALPDLIQKGGAKRPIKICTQDTVEKEYKALSAQKGQFICSYEDSYPADLKATDDAPPVLSCLGNIELLSRKCFAIVGARNASINGRRFTRDIANQLGQNEITVVSGLARGIDTAAHKGALESGTIAVVAGGIDVVYPPENQRLYEKIIEKSQQPYFLTLLNVSNHQPYQFPYHSDTENIYSDKELNKKQRKSLFVGRFFNR